MVKTRVSIRPYQVNYLLQVGEQLGTDDLTEIVSVLINDHRRGCVQTLPKAQVQPVQTTIASVPLQDSDFNAESYEGAESSILFDLDD